MRAALLQGGCGVAQRGIPRHTARMARVLVAVFGFWLLAITARAELRIGAAAVRITPEQPLPMAGYYSIRLSTNTHDESHAKAIVLEQDGARAALVVCDSISLPRSVVVQAREIIAR